MRRAREIFAMIRKIEDISYKEIVKILKIKYVISQISIEIETCINIFVNI